LVVRLKLRLRGKGKVVDVIAVVNSGYEAPTPQLIVPKSVARELSFWPPPPEALELVYDTAGGPLRVWLIQKAISVKVLTEDVESREVIVDLVISPLADEALISDKLIDELEIVIEAAGRGLWRFRGDPPTKLRESIRL